MYTILLFGIWILKSHAIIVIHFPPTILFLKNCMFFFLNALRAVFDKKVFFAVVFVRVDRDCACTNQLMIKNHLCLLLAGF